HVADDRDAAGRVEGEAERAAETARVHPAAPRVGVDRVVEGVARDAAAVGVDVQHLADRFVTVQGVQRRCVGVGGPPAVTGGQPQDGRSINTNPAGKADTAEADLALTMTMVVITDAAAMMTANNSRRRIFRFPSPHLPTDTERSWSGRYTVSLGR